VTAPKKRGCLGCSLPVLIIVGVIALSILAVGFLAGGIGQKLFHVNLPGWLVVPSPEPQFAAPVIFHIFGLPVTNGLLAAWVTVVVLVLLSFLITRRMKLVPGRLQAAFEFVLGWIYDLCKSVAGEKNGRKFFPVICTIFLFVLFNAWLSLIPGYGSILLHRGGTEAELIRGANTDINTPLALAVVSFFFVSFYGLSVLKFGWVRQYFNFGPLFRGIGRIFKGKFSIMDIFEGVIAIFVGVIELLSMLIRMVSFTFRLWGNMTAGEILLLIAAFLFPWVLGLVFYPLELLIGVVQAIIFSLLTLVFVTMAVTAEHEPEPH
jgi:F-type H+-transporting ATPase subunit a